MRIRTVSNSSQILKEWILAVEEFTHGENSGAKFVKFVDATIKAGNQLLQHNPDIANGSRIFETLAEMRGMACSAISVIFPEDIVQKRRGFVVKTENGLKYVGHALIKHTQGDGESQSLRNMVGSAAAILADSCELPYQAQRRMKSVIRAKIKSYEGLSPS